MKTKHMKHQTISKRALLSGALVLLGAGTAFSDTFSATYLASGVHTPVGVTSHYETFNTQTAGTSLSAPFVTNFGGSTYTGTYTGNLNWFGANQYGGAGGSGVFPEVLNGDSYSLALSSPANYFGLWFSALDSGNQLQFYSGNTLLYSFTPAIFEGLVGACPGGPLCGNPNSAFAGQDSGEQFAYLNFYDATGSFSKIVFSEVNNALGGFESDNHAVAMLSSAPGGTPIPNLPEPASAGLVACAGLVLACAGLRKPRRGRVRE